MMILVYGGEKQELQRSIRSELFSAKFADGAIQIGPMQKSRSIKMNALEFGSMKSDNLKNLRISNLLKHEFDSCCKIIRGAYTLKDPFTVNRKVYDISH